MGSLVKDNRIVVSPELQFRIRVLFPELWFAGLELFTVFPSFCNVLYCVSKLGLNMRNISVEAKIIDKRTGVFHLFQYLAPFFQIQS